jgi:ribosomal RNA-processing protein 36
MHLAALQANIYKSEEEDDQMQAQMSKVSFGALAKAQDALSKQEAGGRKRKRGDESSKSQQDKLEALRQRLQEIKAAKLADGPPPKKSKSTKRAKHDTDKDEASSDDDAVADKAPRARSSKHAPAVQSSKKAVSRKRKIVDVKKPVSRDPRFENISGPGPEQHTLDKRYAFLNDYKASEMAELKAAIKKTKNEADKEKLKKKLMSMESQEKARKRKEQEQEVINEHRKKEKELVKQGKTPFFLKKSEQKKIALTNRFEKMKSKERDHAIERRRKKATAKERRNMPAERRGV